jgi:phage terminase large subunit
MVGKINTMKYFRNILLSPTCDRDILEREAASKNQ